MFFNKYRDRIWMIKDGINNIRCFLVTKILIFVKYDILCENYSIRNSCSCMKRG